MVKIIGKSTRVVDFEGLAIDELIGNVATNQDQLSVAKVTISKPTSEPWLTLDYDEWMCVLKGRCCHGVSLVWGLIERCLDVAAADDRW